MPLNILMKLNEKMYAQQRGKVEAISDNQFPLDSQIILIGTKRDNLTIQCKIQKSYLFHYETLKQKNVSE